MKIEGGKPPENPHFAVQNIETAEILTVGSEILMGQIVNTNAAFFARQLADLGISSYYQSSCGDNPERLKAALRQALDRSDCVIVSGGLGPTEDDISMACAAEVAGLPLALNLTAVERIEHYFAERGLRPCSNNLKQAFLPEACQLLVNDHGTAPGALLDFTWPLAATALGVRRCVVLLPGPPSENRPMFTEQLRPLLGARAPFRLHNIFVRLIGIGESAAEEKLRDLIHEQTNPTIAPYCSTGELLFRLSERCAPDRQPERLPLLLAEVQKRLGPYIYEIGERTMPEVVAALCREQGLSLSVAESCTAGLVAAKLGALPGASHYFRGGFITYSNEAKERLLGVSPKSLAQWGAVSAVVAEEMALGCRRCMETDLACAVSGIAGPDGGDTDKPVGTVYIAVATLEGCHSRLFHFRGDRTKIQELSALNALNLLREQLLIQGRSAH